MNGIVILATGQSLGASLSKSKIKAYVSSATESTLSTVLRKMEDEVPKKCVIFKADPVNKERDCEKSAGFAPAMKLA